MCNARLVSHHELPEQLQNNKESSSESDSENQEENDSAIGRENREKLMRQTDISKTVQPDCENIEITQDQKYKYFLNVDNLESIKNVEDIMIPNKLENKTES